MKQILSSHDFPILEVLLKPGIENLQLTYATNAPYCWLLTVSVRTDCLVSREFTPFVLPTNVRHLYEHDPVPIKFHYVSTTRYH